LSEPVQIALIVAVAPTLLALAGVVNSVRNSQKLNTIHVDLNSRLTQLLLATGASAHANGKAEGVAQERAAQISE
jgi:hypothetical protein